MCLSGCNEVTAVTEQKSRRPGKCRKGPAHIELFSVIVGATAKNEDDGMYCPSIVSLDV